MASTMASALGAPDDRSFEAAIAALRGSISQGSALAAAAARRESTVAHMHHYCAVCGLDLNARARPWYVHVAGSKGKGTTCAMLDAVLRARGLRVGLFTSPHLVSDRERVRVDGRPLTRAAFAIK